MISSAEAPPERTGSDRAPSEQAPSHRADADRGAKWVIALLFAALFVPGSFYLGVRLTPIRFYLIVMAVPMTLRFLKDPGLKVNAVDVILFLAIFWRSLALIANHRAAEIPLAGASFIELFFAYLLTRVYVRSAEDYRFFFRCFLVTLIVVLPFALLETVSRTRVLRRLASIVLAQPEEVVEGVQIRFGLMRVQAFLEHAVLWGMFCAIGVSNFYYLYHDRFLRRGLYAGYAAFMTLLAISSSSMLALAIQVCMIVYERLFRPIWSKWIVLAVAAGAFLLSFELIFGMSIGAYIATELSLNQAGAETRLDQITYGLKEVWRHPVFGIGLNIPALPFWRSDIFDNFWLHTAVRYGLPSFLFIAGAFALHFALIALHRSEGEDYDMIRRGYQIALATTILLVGSIPVWGSALVFFMAYLGAGAWFYTMPRDLPPRGTLATRPARTPADRPARATGRAPETRPGKRGARIPASPRPGVARR